MQKKLMHKNNNYTTYLITQTVQQYNAQFSYINLNLHTMFNNNNITHIHYIERYCNKTGALVATSTKFVFTLNNNTYAVANNKLQLQQATKTQAMRALCVLDYACTC